MRGQVNHAGHGSGGAAHWRGRQGRLGWRRIVAGSWQDREGGPHGQGGMALTGGILAAVGRFPQDEAVLARASRIAAAHGLALSVVHVVDLGGAEPLPGAATLLAETAGAAVRTDIAAALKRIGAEHPGNVIHIETGAPALRLIELAEELRPDLVVMRMNQRDRITARVLGSTTDRVIRSAVAPVLVVKRPVLRDYRRVILALDGSDDARATLRCVTQLLPEARLQLVQAVDLAPPLAEAMLRAGTDQAGLAAHGDALARAAAANLDTLAAGLDPAPALRVLRGDPADALIRASRSRHVDLIGLGPGRASLIRRAFIGSVTRRVLGEAACDVLICHAADDGRDR